MRFTDEITVRLIQASGGDHMVVAAARVSTSGEDAAQYAVPTEENQKKTAGLIRFLMQHRHGTPFEHSTLTFFVHAPIFVFREWHRHRVGFSYNEESARYKQLDPVFWVPKRTRKIVPAADHTSARPHFTFGTDEQWEWLVEDLKAGYIDAYERYQRRIDKGYAKEVARAGLPVGIYSSCCVTCNPRSLMHFLSLRVHDAAAKFVSYPQAEIEEAARAAEIAFAAGWPVTHAAFIEGGRVAP